MIKRGGVGFFYRNNNGKIQAERNQNLAPPSLSWLSGRTAINTRNSIRKCRAPRPPSRSNCAHHPRRQLQPEGRWAPAAITTWT